MVDRTSDEHAAWAEFVAQYEAFQIEVDELGEYRSSTLDEWRGKARAVSAAWERLRAAWRAFVEIRDHRRV